MTDMVILKYEFILYWMRSINHIYNFFHCIYSFNGLNNIINSLVKAVPWSPNSCMPQCNWSFTAVVNCLLTCEPV